MAKKKKNTGFMGLLKEGMNMFADVGVNAIIGNLREAAHDAMDDAQQRIQDATIKVLKAISIFIIMIFGFILLIAGMGTYLSATVPALHDGLGFVAIGGGLIVLGLIIQFFKS